MSDTSATRPDPETGAEGDTDQLTAADTLVDRGVDPLDEGYECPDRPSRHLLTTDRENALGEDLDQRLAQESPEVWEAEPVTQEGRVGRLETTPDGGVDQDVVARDDGRAGGAASAEEAAMHLVADDEDTETDWDDQDGAPTADERD